MAKIPPSTIVLILLFKVFPPWVDTWSDVAWVKKLFQSGGEFTQSGHLNLEHNPMKFFDMMKSCSDFQLLQ